ncbi:MAG: hypothetical protein GY929_03630 [Actinomycetia bacterium]|nr:hypothetical protein [Actinomycetes bacterium]
MGSQPGPVATDVLFTFWQDQGPGLVGALGFVAVSTRKLIVLALLCGLAILVAFTVQILQGTS